MGNESNMSLTRRRRSLMNCPENAAAASVDDDWECRIETKESIGFFGRRRRVTYSQWYPPGHAALHAANVDDIYENIQCRSLDSGNPTCRGLCGRYCDCWEAI